MTVILLRHGRSTSNTAHTLAGRAEGVDLDDKGREQAAGVVERVAELLIKALVRSPLLRCERTLEPLAQKLGLQPVVDNRLVEVDYGAWTGRKISELVKEPLWAVVQQQPSAAIFPRAKVWRRSRRARWPRCASTTGDWPRSTAATPCGWPAPTAT